MSDEPKGVPAEELEQRCGHECLSKPGHMGPHFYGYTLGPHSYEGVKAQRDAAEAEVVRLTDGIREAADEVVEATGVDDHYLAVQLRSLLDVAGDDALDEIVRVSEGSGLYGDLSGLVAQEDDR